MINTFIQWLRRTLLPEQVPLVYKHQWTSWAWVGQVWTHVDPEVCKYCKVRRAGLQEFDPCEGPS